MSIDNMTINDTEMTTSSPMSLIRRLLFVIVLIVLPQAVFAKPKVYSFSENFNTQKFQDKKATTATWSTTDGTVTLPYITVTQRLGVEDGLPNIRFSSINGKDSTWLLGGNTLTLPTQVVHSNIWQFSNSTYTDLLTPFKEIHGARQGTMTAVGYNGSYWLIGGPGLLFKYDGSTLTELSSQYSAALSGYPTSITWNGSMWLFTGGTNGLGSFDGTTFQNLWSAASFPSNYHTAAWNVGKKRWLVVFQGGTKVQNIDVATVYSFDGSSFKQIDAPDELGNIYHVASDGKQWFLAGWSALTQKSTLFLYDGKKFKNFSSKLNKITKSIPSNIIWEGKYWLLRTAASDSTAASFFAMKRNGSSLKKIFYSGKNADFQYGDSGAIKLSNSWLVGGNAFSDSQTALLVRGTDVYQTGKVVQSKVVATAPSNIGEVTLVADSREPSGTSITYEVSNNAGKNWITIMPNTATPLESTGKKLRWRATLETTDPDVTPTLTKVTLRYRLGLIRSFVEDFSTTKYRDGNATTADWNITESIGQLATAGDGSYQSPGKLQSTRINKKTLPIVGVWLKSTHDTPEGTEVSYEVSADNGKHWSAIQPDKLVDMNREKGQLRWRANLSSTSTTVTPTVIKVKILYLVKSIENE